MMFKQRNRFRRCRLAILFTILPLFGQFMNVARAHDGPLEVIRELNRSLRQQGPTAELLFRRAMEFQALRQDGSAVADLERCLKLDPSQQAARFQLARLRLKIEQQAETDGQQSASTGEPLDAIGPLLNVPDETVRTAARALRAEIYMVYRDYDEAIVDFSEAIRVQPKLEWFLSRAHAQRQLNDFDDCLAGLEAAFEKTHSPVALAELCDSLIAAVQFERRQNSPPLSPNGNDRLKKAEQLIAGELEDHRLKSAWWIRRAQVQLLRGQPAKARRDLNNAITELDSRLNTARPDPELVRSRAFGAELLMTIQ